MSQHGIPLILNEDGTCVVCGEQVLKVYDNGGQSIDRYTAVFDDRPWLGVGETGNVPNGFCMTVEGVEGPHLGTLVSITDLPEAARRAITQYAEEEL